jgi:hypothetical protein
MVDILSGSASDVARVVEWRAEHQAEAFKRAVFEVREHDRPVKRPGGIEHWKSGMPHRLPECSSYPLSFGDRLVSSAQFFEVPVGRLKDADSVEAPLVPGQQTGLADEVVGERVDPTPHDEQR